MRLVFSILVLVLLTPFARADYPTEQALERLSQIERALDGYVKPDWFDGTRVTANPEARWADLAVTSCNSTTGVFDTQWRQLDTKFQTSDRGRAVQRHYNEMVPYCRSLAAAVAEHKKGLDAKAAQQAAEAKADAALAGKRREFQNAIPPVGVKYLHNFVEAYDESLNSNGNMSRTSDAAFWREAKEGYLAVREVCKKYPGLANPTGPNPSRYILARPVDICAMAERGEELVQKIRRKGALEGITWHTDDYLKIVQRFLDEAQKDLPELVQLMVFDQEAFVAIQNKEFAPLAAKIGETVPTNAWDRAYSKNTEIKAKIDEYGAVSFAMPKFHDKAAEGAAKAAFAKEIKGVKVRKISTDWAKWNLWDEKLWVGSDATYDYYKINKGKNKYMRGAALLEIPGRPYCQVRTWEVGRVYNGPIKVSPFDHTGTFAKCD